MATLSGGILDHPCDNDDVKMETIYQTDYIKRGYRRGIIITVIIELLKFSRAALDLLQKINACH